MAISHPTDISDCQLCCLIESLAGTADGTAISQWDDDSGNDRHLTASGDGRPTYRTNQVNGWPALDFDGTDDFFTIPDFMSAYTAAEIMVVVKLDADPPAAAAKTGLWRSNDSNIVQGYPATSGSILETWGATAQFATGNPSFALTDLQCYGVSVQAGTNNFRTYFNSRRFYQGTATVSFGTTLYLGRNYSNYYLDGKILGIFIWNRVLTGDERRDLSDWAFRYFVAPSHSKSDYWTTLLALSPDMLWKMDEASGTTAADASGNSRDGTYANAPTFSQDSLIPSLDDTCVEFNGSNEYTYINDAAWMQPADNKTFSTIFAYMPLSLSAQRDICGKQEMWQLWQETTGKVTFYVTPAWTGLTSDVVLDEDRSHLIMIRKDGTAGKIAILVDGRKVAEASHSGSLTDNANGLYFANGSIANRYMNCRGQGYAYLVDTAVTDAQFADLYFDYLASLGVTIAPGRIESEGGVFQPAIIEAKKIQPARIEALGEVLEPVITHGVVSILPARIEALGEVFAPRLGTPGYIVVSNIIAALGTVFRPKLVTYEDPCPYEYQAQFEALTHTLVGTSTTRRPDAISLDYLTCFSPGPTALQDTSEGLVVRPWRARYDADEGLVYLATNDGAGGSWGTETPIDSILMGIVEMDVAFTENGDPTLVAETDDGHVWIYWFDPLVPGYVWQDFGLGRTPRIILDDVRTITGASDVQVFYISDAEGSVIQLQQRDRYAIPYTVPISTDSNTFLEDVVTGRDRRMHIIYSMRNPVRGRYALGKLTSHPFPLLLDPEGVSVSGRIRSGRLQVVYFDATLDPEMVSVSGRVASGMLSPVLYEYTLVGDLDVTPVTAALAVTEILLDGYTDPEEYEVEGSVPEGVLAVAVFERTLDRADYEVSGSVTAGVLG